MIRGAFKKIKHDHLFEESGKSTLMKDKFEFESHGGLAGRIFNHLVVKKYLRIVREKRNKMIKEVAEGEQWKKILNL